jgi:Na+-driven multidrug efflux pump
MYVFAPQVLGIFTNDAHVIAIGVPLVHITAIFSPVLGFVFIFQNFLRNSSDIAPTIWMSASEILARSILSFVFSALFGFTGIWWATPVGWTGSMLIGCLRYRSGRWKQKSIASRQRLAGAGDTCPAAPSDTIV